MGASAALCGRCGAGLERGSKFCGACGASLAPSEDLSHRKIGSFVLESEIGRGGMGVVYRGRDTRLHRNVAVKLIAPSIASDEQFRSRFQHEARAAAAIEHPNVLPVFETGEQSGELFLAMRLVDGTDLKEILRMHGRLRVERAATLVAQIAAALDAAHARGLVHRDVKPGNVLVSPQGSGDEHVYLTDFGLAKIADHSTDLTGTGHVIGTANYISPEQINGREVDGRADAYALACVAFECLTGRPPFARESPALTLAAHAQAPIPGLADHLELPGEVIDRVFRIALAKDPAERFATCGAFASALGTVAREGKGPGTRQPQVPAAQPRDGRAVPGGVRPGPTATVQRERPKPSRNRRSPILAMVAGTIAALGIAIGGYFALPAVLGAGSDPDGGEAARSVLAESRGLTESISDMMTRLSNDPFNDSERERQLRRITELRSDVDLLWDRARSSVPEEIRPSVLATLESHERLLLSYEDVLHADPESAQPLIEGMLEELSRLDRDTSGTGLQMKGADRVTS